MRLSLRMNLVSCGNLKLFNMNVFDLELFRQYLLLNLPKTHGRSKIFLLFDLYKALLESNDRITINAFLIEFL